MHIRGGSIHFMLQRVSFYVIQTMTRHHLWHISTTPCTWIFMLAHYIKNWNDALADYNNELRKHEIFVFKSLVYHKKYRERSNLLLYRSDVSYMQFDIFIAKYLLYNMILHSKITKMPISLDYIDLYSHFISIIHYRNLLTGKSVWNFC